MALCKYEVICDGPQGQATFWDGTDLRKKGTIVEIDTDLMKVSAKSMSLKSVGDSPVFDKDGKPKK